MTWYRNITEQATKRDWLGIRICIIEYRPKDYYCTFCKIIKNSYTYMVADSVII